MSDQPLGIADLFLDRDLEAPTVHEMPEVWFWCRRHEQAHKVGEKCDCNCARVFTAGEPSGHRADCPQSTRVSNICIDVGPFMSEYEACRLAETLGWGGTVVRMALGMEVET